MDDQKVHETLRTITVRIPKSLHQAVGERARANRVSMNAFCEAAIREAIKRSLADIEPA
jgi:predicted HicB family RNase H-like nuclease